MKNFLSYLLLNKKIIAVLIILILAVLIILLLSLGPGLSVTGSFPQQGSRNIDSGINPYISFSKSLVNKEQSSISVKSSPSTSFSMYWSSDGKTVYLVPSRPLLLNTEYNISVSYPGGSYSWNFKTKSVVSKPDQGQIDYNFNKDVHSFYSSHPWYQNLPPPNDEFFIGFESDEKGFFVDLYPKIASSSSVDEQTTQLKNTVLTTLASLGVDLSKYKVSWIVSPR